MNSHTHDSEEAEGWEQKFDKKIHGWHGNRDDIVHPDEFFYSIDGIKQFIRETRAEAYLAGLEEARRVVPKDFWTNYEYDPEFRNGWDSYRKVFLEAITRRIEENS